MRIRLKKLRLKRKKTPEDMARDAGFSVEYYKELEKGTGGDISLDTAKRLADALQFDWELFFRQPSCFVDKLPYYIRFNRINKKTGQLLENAPPKDASALFDGFGEALGYKRLGALNKDQN